MHQEIITQATRGRGTYELTGAIDAVIARSEIDSGLCHVFVQHTSASLIVCENADPSVRSDLEGFLARLVRDGDPAFDHDMEGPDDMPAHVRSILTQTGLTLPVIAGRCALGTWQGVYLYEHRRQAHQRRLVVTVSD